MAAMPESESKLNAKDIKEFIEQTGFILEMKTVNLLKSKGYSVESSEYFLDWEDKKNREIDVVASKELNGIRVNLIIECKQSLRDEWIFVCSDSSASRFYSYAKYYPSFENREFRPLKNLHIFNQDRFPLAQNYTTIERKKKKKSDHLQIDEALHKLPKALIYLASRSDTTRNLYFLITIFSGRIFLAQHLKKLSVKEVKGVQYVSRFEADIYKTGPTSTDQDDVWSEMESEKMTENYKRYNPQFLIEFIPFKFFSNYLKALEAGVMNMDIGSWKVREIDPNDIPF